MSINDAEKSYEYTTLMNMLHVSVSKHMLDEHFTLVWANDFYYDLIGYKRVEYEKIYNNQCSLYYKENQDEWNKISSVVLTALKEGKKEYSLPSRMRRKNGEYVWVRMSGTFVDEYINGYQVSYTVMTDINDIMQMQMEQSITYDNLPGFTAKYRVGPELQFTLLEANDRFVDFFGEGCFQNLEDSLFRNNLERNKEVIGRHKEELLAGDPVQFTTRMQDQYGNDAWLQINAACIDRWHGDPVYLAIYIDITEETELRHMQNQLEKQAKELQTALKEAEYANRAKSDFLSHMSHDIRTPMNAIIGMTDIALGRLDDPEKLKDCLKKISLSSQHLLGLINDVLDMSRIESGKMVINYNSMSLPVLLEDIVAIIQPNIKAKNQKFAIHLHNVRHESFCSDALRLRQIFINILSNASKFTPLGGEICVNIEEAESDDTEKALFHFSFVDSGIGMNQEFVKHIFDPFTREQDSRVDKIEGSGLGMAITKKLTELLGGKIAVESREGSGTTFLITMPLQIEEVQYCAAQYPDLKILVVDDDHVMCEYMEKMLNEMGINVDISYTGEQALSNIVKEHDKGKDYDAIFLDWKMPDVDGAETARKIRGKIGKECPILIVSAYDWSDIEEEAQVIGIDGFISKPIFVSTLCHAVQKYVLNYEEEDEHKKHDAIDFSGKHFLMVEDNELNREITTELLCSTGAEIICAGNGKEGVEAFAASPVNYFDLILMDVQMPVMNGYDATVHIRKMDREDAERVPILAMTADAFIEDISRAKEVKMDGHLSKPINMETLEKEIYKILKQKGRI